MRIEDLKDPRDRAAMERLQSKTDGIVEERAKDTHFRVYHNADGSCHPECRIIAGYDNAAEREFQSGHRSERSAMAPEFGHNREGRVGNIGLRFGKQED